MGPVAVLADVHANPFAFEAVLLEVAGSGIDRVVIAGDVTWGPFPSETLALVEKLGERAVVIRGNADREIFTREPIGIDWMDEVAAWCADRLSPGQLETLRSWPEVVRLELDGIGKVLVCHGSPRADDEPIAEATPLPRVRAMLADADADASLVVCGHTHAQFVRTVDGTTLLNPGSVGLPFGEPGAYWAVVGPGLELRHTPYDTAAAGRAVAASPCPHAASFVEQIVTPPPWETANERFAEAS